MKMSFGKYDGLDCYRLTAKKLFQWAVILVSTDDVYDIEILQCDGKSCEFKFKSGKNFKGEDLSGYYVEYLPRELLSAVVPQ